MTVIKPVQYVGQLDDSNIQNNHVLSDAKSVQTGVYHIVNGSTDKTCHLEIGGNPNSNTSTNPIHVGPLSTEYVKGVTPKRANIVDATAANPTVLTVGGGGTPAHSFVVGDYITITGAGVSAYNVSHKQVTAVTNGTITVDADLSSAAAFTGSASAANSIKISARGSGGNSNLSIYISEVAIIGS